VYVRNISQLKLFMEVSTIFSIASIRSVEELWIDPVLNFAVNKVTTGLQTPNNAWYVSTIPRLKQRKSI
jgi:hypothetical protein